MPRSRAAPSAGTRRTCAAHCFFSAQFLLLICVIVPLLCTHHVGAVYTGTPAKQAMPQESAESVTEAFTKLGAPVRHIVVWNPESTEKERKEHRAHVEHASFTTKITHIANRNKGAALKLFSEEASKPNSTSFEFGPHLSGYVVDLTRADAELVRASRHVLYVEEDKVMRIARETKDSPVRRQLHATWGIARISHRAPGNDAVNGDSDTYTYPKQAGAGVVAYIIDTGVLTRHTDFGGRAVWGKTFCELEPIDMDLNGHGTHVAGTVGGTKYGVAKNVSIVAVKVMTGDGQGMTSDIIQAIAWVASEHKRRAGQDPSKRARSVANLSLGGEKSRVLDDAVNAAVAAGVHFAVAAGNDYENACNYSPAAAASAVTVGATTREDELAFFSNHGKCVDVLAPGHEIKSSYNSDPDATAIMSGTSMASPHVCGLMAVTLSVHEDSTIMHDEMVKHIIENATNKTIHNIPKPGHHRDGVSPFPGKDDQKVSTEETDSTLSHINKKKSGEGKTPNRLIYVLEPDSIEPGSTTAIDAYAELENAVKQAADNEVSAEKVVANINDAINDEESLSEMGPEEIMYNVFFGSKRKVIRKRSVAN